MLIEMNGGMLTIAPRGRPEPRQKDLHLLSAVDAQAARRAQIHRDNRP